MAFRRAISAFQIVGSSSARLAREGDGGSGLNRAINPAALQIQRLRSSSGKISIGPEMRPTEKDEDGDVVYHGPISGTIKKVKLLSLSTCCLSVSLGPVITFMTSPDMNVILKGAVASTVIVLSASTTAALHWFVSPYVHRLRRRPGADSVEAELMTWLATPTWKTVRLADVQHAATQRPFVTFRAGGNLFFVDRDHFKDKALLARLTPSKPSVKNL
ncbi:uncharacterized protein LOC144714526 [Wolffia australiana]